MSTCTALRSTVYNRLLPILVYAAAMTVVAPPVDSCLFAAQHSGSLLDRAARKSRTLRRAWRTSPLDQVYYPGLITLNPTVAQL